uniref:Uncharacterized protein n=1 Tax=Anopheles dirus TaxID=7168 RepID=A0A182NW88_9DIPT
MARPIWKHIRSSSPERFRLDRIFLRVTCRLVNFSSDRCRWRSRARSSSDSFSRNKSIRLSRWYSSRRACCASSMMALCCSSSPTNDSLRVFTSSREFSGSSNEKRNEKKCPTNVENEAKKRERGTQEPRRAIYTCASRDASRPYEATDFAMLPIGSVCWCVSAAASSRSDPARVRVLQPRPTTGIVSAGPDFCRILGPFCADQQRTTHCLRPAAAAAGCLLPLERICPSWRLRKCVRNSVVQAYPAPVGPYVPPVACTLIVPISISVSQPSVLP